MRDLQFTASDIAAIRFTVLQAILSAILSVAVLSRVTCIGTPKFQRARSADFYLVCAFHITCDRRN